jgi:ABC-type multidrug transport system ATPase subunit
MWKRRRLRGWSFSSSDCLPIIDNSVPGYCTTPLRSSAADVAEKQAKVAEVISQLNLQRCTNTYMGNRLIRGVSGGEMKRTAVACALLCSPQCMFLDEPTSG